MILGLALDGLLVVLLAATIAFALQLNRRLAAARADQGEFARLAASFAEAAARAEDSVARLKVAAGAGQDEIERADRLAEGAAQTTTLFTTVAQSLTSVLTTASDIADRTDGNATAFANTVRPRLQKSLLSNVVLLERRREPIE